MACGDRSIPFSLCKIILAWRQDFINLAQRFESHRFLETFYLSSTGKVWLFRFYDSVMIEFFSESLKKVYIYVLKGTFWKALWVRISKEAYGIKFGIIVR